MKITHERRAALLEVFSDALRLTDDQERRPSDEKNEQTGWFSDEMCDADNVIRDLLDWVRDAEEYLDQRADVDDGRPNAAMRLLDDLRAVFKTRVPS